MAAYHHKALIASLGADQRAKLTLRTNSHGLRYLLVHAGSILVLMTLVLLQIPFWPLFLLPLGVGLVFLFTLMHETTHRTAFKTKRFNDLIAFSCGWLLFLPPRWFRYFHFSHHRYTQDPERDPELLSPKPKLLSEYLWHISGLPVAMSQLKTLTVNAFGRHAYGYVPPDKHNAIMWESRLLLGSYLAIITVFLLVDAIEVLVFCWWLPLLLGQPFLRLYLMAEHGRCAFVTNMFENTRTVFTSNIVRRLAWNMPFHAEHHAYPNVPFHRLPDLHQQVKHHLQVTSQGYSEFHRDSLRVHMEQCRGDRM